MFEMNGIHWDVFFVPRNDRLLTRSDGSRTVGMTDRKANRIYIADDLQGAFLWRVLCHEITHAAMLSYSVFLTIEQEEIVADIISRYGGEIIATADSIFTTLKEGIA